MKINKLFVPIIVLSMVFKSHASDLQRMHEESNPALMLSVLFKNSDNVNRLLKEGADVNYVNEQGDTPLRLAVGNGFNHIIKILLNYNPKIDDSNRFGHSLLDLAVKNNNREALHMLHYYLNIYLPNIKTQIISDIDIVMPPVLRNIITQYLDFDTISNDFSRRYDEYQSRNLQSN